MSKVFNQTPVNKLPTNVFDLSHERKLTCKMGQLIPCLVMDVVPGDKVSVKSSCVVRLAPMVYPVMHKVSAYIHYFFVPNRILWKNWADFITGGQVAPFDNDIAPYINVDLSAAAVGSLHDHLGLPVGSDLIGAGTGS